MRQAGIKGLAPELLDRCSGYEHGCSGNQVAVDKRVFAEVTGAI